MTTVDGAAVGDRAAVEPASSTQDPAPVRIGVVSTRRLAWIAGVTVATTVGLGIAAAAIRYKALAVPGGDALFYLFNLDSEFNVPTIVSVLGLAACAALLAVVAGVARTRAPRDATRFAGLAAIFLYIALDEGSRLHERLNEPIAELGLSSGYLRFGWVVVFGLVVLALVPIYLPLVWRLPPLVRALFLVSAATYVTGALVVEMIGASVYAPGTPLYVGLTVVEETMELGGIALFLVALRTLLDRWAPSIVAELRDPEAATADGG